jgi:hypothetical protein
MACDDATAASEALAAAALKPKRVRGDAGEVEMHSLRDIREAAEYLAGQCGASTARRGLRFTKINPPGTV